jgi:hypothetical protein
MQGGTKTNKEEQVTMVLTFGQWVAGKKENRFSWIIFWVKRTERVKFSRTI